MAKAIIVGSINMDIVTYVQKHPQVGETVFCDDVKYFPGGKGSNQAISCKRLGCDTTMIARVGDDEYGQEMIRFQENEGIHTKEVKKLKDAATGRAFITVSQDSQNSIIVMSGANSIWDDTFLDSTTFEKDDVAIAQFEVPNDVIKKTFLKAKREGATTILNPAPIREIDEVIKNNTDILILNEIELQELTSTIEDLTNKEALFNHAKELMQSGYKTIIVTLGSAGVLLLDQQHRIIIEARTVTPVDTTGAGDTFIGGIASGLLRGLDIIETIEFANIAASLSVTRQGAASSIPNLEEVNEIFWTTKS